MTETPTCMGCCLNPNFLNSLPNTWQLYGEKMPEFFTKAKDNARLTENETLLLGYLGHAWAFFCNLDKKSGDDIREFQEGIHRLQQLVALRVARRANPEVWAQPNE